jgi:molybdenum cofactor cytidylyltransferase
MNVAMLMAAGCSSRLGSPKQLLDWQSMPLIDWTIEHLEGAGCDGIVVVLGATPELICEQSIRLRKLVASSETFHAHEQPASAIVKIVINEEWRDGQGTSLQAGIAAALKDFPGLQKLLVCTCDQPRVISPFYRRLLDAVGEATTIAAARYDSGGGVPACFAAAALPGLIGSTKQSGAKEWIRSRDPATVRLVEMPTRLSDIDTREDYFTLRDQANSIRHAPTG